MATELYILKHRDDIGPGWLMDRIQEHGVAYRIRTIRQGRDLPMAVDCNGVVCVGLDVDYEALQKRDPLLREEIVFVRTAVGLGVPYLGLGRGAQLLARALLGQVLAERIETVGAATLSPTPQARQDLLFHGLDPVPVIHWPLHRIALPPRSVVLSGTEENPEVFRLFDSAWGLLPHLEATPHALGDWLAERGESTEALRSAALGQEAAQRAAAYQVMDRFIERTRTFCHFEPPVIGPRPGED